MGSSVSIQIQQSIGADAVYRIFGSLALVVSFVLIFGLKDIKVSSKKKQKDS